MNRKIMIVFGTRPEAIKMCPLIKELRKRTFIKTIICVTGQHRQMLDQVLNVFQIKPDYDLDIMKENQNLFDITTNVMNGLKEVLEKEQPDIVLVHGDTSTTLAVAISCYYLKIEIAHVEAGLRTYDIYSPYPEEFNRQAVSLISRYNFVPTERAKENLINEGKKRETIYVTGNTVIDALKTTIKDSYTHSQLEWAKDSKLLLITVHRRENIGEPMERIFNSILRIVRECEDVKVVYPIHMNPVIREIANSILGEEDRIHIIEPLGVIDFHNFLNRCYMILTDSGGVQEEAAFLGKPVLVLRDITERSEGVDTGILNIVGTDEKAIYKKCKTLLENKEQYEKTSNSHCPYGDGTASVKIADVLEGYFKID